MVGKRWCVKPTEKSVTSVYSWRGCRYDC